MGDTGDVDHGVEEVVAPAVGVEHDEIVAGEEQIVPGHDDHKRPLAMDNDDPPQSQSKRLKTEGGKDEEHSEDGDWKPDGPSSGAGYASEADEPSSEEVEADDKEGLALAVVEREFIASPGDHLAVVAQPMPDELLPNSLLLAVRRFGQNGMRGIKHALLEVERRNGSIDAPEYGKADSPLHVAVKLPDENDALLVISFLVSKGATVDCSDKVGASPLAIAASLDRVDFMRLLMRMGASVNHSNRHLSGDTPLHYAARWGNVKAMRMLTDAGADINLRNSYGQLPFDVIGMTRNNKDITLAQRTAVRQFLMARDESRRVAIYYHEDFLLHQNIPDHQEGLDRVTTIVAMLKKQFTPENPKVKSMSFAQQFEMIDNFDVCTREELLLAHTDDYVAFVETLNDRLHGVHNPGDEHYDEHLMDQEGEDGATMVVPFTPELLRWRHSNKHKISSDTGFSKGTLQAARRAVGACCAAVDAVCAGKNSSAFAVVRPPGHHAGPAGLVEEGSSCGFCIFNNVAVATAYALKKYPDMIRRVAILDFDVHHGNGTEACMDQVFQPANKENVFFVSFHLYSQKHSFYPQSGRKQNVRHNVLNIPLGPPCEDSCSEKTPVDDEDLPLGREGFVNETTNRMLPALRAFHPDLIFISAGFDAAENDFGNAGLMDFSTEDYAWFTAQVKEVADLTCAGRIISVLEGGYGGDSTMPESFDRKLLARNCVSHVMAMAGLEEYFEPFRPAQPSSSDSESSGDGRLGFDRNDGKHGSGGEDEEKGERGMELHHDDGHHHHRHQVHHHHHQQHDHVVHHEAVFHGLEPEGGFQAQFDGGDDIPVTAEADTVAGQPGVEGGGVGDIDGGVAEQMEL